MERIPIAGPWITDKEITYVTDAVQSAWYDEAGKYHQRFEEAFARYAGRRYAIALPSCTSALHLALLSLEIGPGDEVIVPDITWIATAAPISYVGATPIFADIHPRTWCLSANALEAVITPRSRAVIVVDLYGNMPDMEAILKLAEHHGLAVIEDAAQAIGSQHKGKMAGSFGEVSVFSFHGSKTLTTGEGGMLVTDRQDIYERCSFLRDHGRSPGEKLFWNSEVAYKYRMSNMQAALGLAQLERIEALITRKREIYGWYEACLEGVKGVTLNHEAAGTLNTYWMVTAVLNAALGWEKELLMKALSAEGIDSRPFFYPLSQLPAYGNLPQSQEAASRNTVAYGLSPYGINLPSALCLTKDQVQRVCAVLRGVLSKPSTAKAV